MHPIFSVTTFSFETLFLSALALICDSEPFSLMRTVARKKRGGSTIFTYYAFSLVIYNFPHPFDTKISHQKRRNGNFLIASEWTRPVMKLRSFDIVKELFFVVFTHTHQHRFVSDDIFTLYSKTFQQSPDSSSKTLPKPERYIRAAFILFLCVFFPYFFLFTRGVYENVFRRNFRKAGAFRVS